MRKRLLHLFSAVCIFGFTANAEVIQNYEYNFDDESIASTSYHPLGWGRSEDSGTYSFSEDGRSGLCMTGTQYDAESQYWNDLIITPVFTGSASIYVRGNSADSSIRFFSVTTRKDATTWNYEALNLTTELTQGEWVKVDLPPCPMDGRIGIRLHNASVDDFHADSVDTDVAAYEKLEIGMLSRVSGGSVNGDKNNQFEIEYTINIKNSGEVSYEPGDANYTLSHIFPQIEGSVCDISFPEGLAAGETKTMTVKATLTVTSEPFSYKQLAVRENISGTSKNLGSFSYTPYIPDIKLLVGGTSNEYGSTPQAYSEPYVPYISFAVADAASRMKKTVTIKNTGSAAPLTVTGISATEGFSVDFNGPLTIEAGNTADFEVELTETAAGIYRGELSIESEELATQKAHLVAALPDAGKWHEDFEGETFAPGFILSGNWGTGDIFYAYSTEGHEKVMANGTTQSELITPKLRVEEGEKMLISGYSYDYDAVFTVDYSSDRHNWINAYDSSKADYTNKFAIDKYNVMNKLMSVVAIENIPAGEWYVRINGKNMNIDDIYGYTMLPAKDELYLRESTVPAGGKVNTLYEATAEIMNLGSALEADDYSVNLYLGDELFASAETGEFAAGETKTFTMSGMPHEAGEYDARIEIVMGEDVLSSETIIVTITQETSTGDVIIVGESTRTTQNGPVYRSGNRKEEILYTKDYIEANSDGIEPGSKISSITFRGTYVYEYGSLPTIHSNLKVYVKNETAAKLEENGYESYSFSDQETMTKVFEGPIEISQMQAGGDLFTIPFDAPFEYGGEGIAIQIESVTESVSSSREINYYGVSKYDNGCVAYNNDTPFGATGRASTYIPTIGFGLSADVATVSGKVTHAVSKEPLADVAITLESPENVVYKTVTDENGEYTVSVLQPDKQYKVKASKENLDDYESEDYLDLSAMSATHHFTMTGVMTGVASISSDSLTISATEGGIIIRSVNATDVAAYDLLGRAILRLDGFTGEKKVELTSGIYVVNGRKIAVK